MPVRGGRGSASFAEIVCGDAFPGDRFGTFDPGCLDSSPAGCEDGTSPATGGCGGPSPASANPGFGVAVPDFNAPFVGLLPLALRCRLFSTCIVRELVGNIN